MKKLNKKGFTIIELVIVIAVIAILAAVLIPTFSNVIKNANASSAMQAAESAYIEALAIVMEDGNISANESATINGFTFTWTDSDNCTCTYSAANAGSGNGNEAYAKYDYTVKAGKITVADKKKL